MNANTFPTWLRTLSIAAPLVHLTAVLVAQPAAAVIIGPVVTMETLDGEPAMVNAPDVLNPRTNVGGIKVITINPNTGVLYGIDTGIANNGRPQLWLLDTSVVSKPSAPVNALVGTTGNPGGSNTTQYTGSVKDGAKDRNSISHDSLTFNPDFKDGVLIGAGLSNNNLQFQEWAVQDNSVDWGETVEPQGVNTIAFFGNASLNFGCCSRDAREASGFLDTTTVTGTGAGEKYRYLYVYRSASNNDADALRVAHVDTTYTTAPTNTSAGTRDLATRPGGDTIMNNTQLDALAPTGALVSGMAIRGEVSADVFDVYFMFSDLGTSGEADDLTYLAGVQATVPSDGTAMSYEVIDLDHASANTWIQLKDTVADADIAGTGIAFSGDGNHLYVAGYLNYSEGNSYDAGRIYIFEVPEPSTFGLLSIAGLLLLAGPLRRRVC